MSDHIQAYRQPMVTATGIILGFVLNFAGVWVSNAFTADVANERIIASGLCISITLLIMVLYRILNMDYPKEKAAAYYKKTLLFFVWGLVVPFLTIIIILIKSLFMHGRFSGG